jgi:hypothetical protein
VCAKTRYLWFRGFGLSQVVDIKKTIGVSKLKIEGKPKPDSGNFLLPSDMRREIIDVLGESNALRKEIRMTNMERTEAFTDAELYDGRVY